MIQYLALSGLLLTALLGMTFFLGFCIGKFKYDKSTKRFS